MGSPNNSPPVPAADGEMVTMVFTDLLNSTLIKSHLEGSRLQERNRTYLTQILQPHRQRIQDSLPDYGGQCIKMEGDACLLAFSQVTAALNWAIALQQSHERQPIATPLGPLQVRIGVHTGNPIPCEGDLIGEEVDYAFRVVTLAQGGQILVSELSTVLAKNFGSKAHRFHNHGLHLLKGIGYAPIFELLLEQPPRSPRVDVNALVGEGHYQFTPLPDRDQGTGSAGVGRRHWARQLLFLGLISLGCTAAVSGVRWLGLLQPLELTTLDTLMRLRPKEAPDPRILMITVTSQDLQQQTADSRRSSLSDKDLTRLLQLLETYQTRVVGLDIYRDFPVEAGAVELERLLRNNPNLIAVCKARDATSDLTGVAPPPEIPPARLGFSDFVEDADGIVRRQLFFMSPDPLSPCPTAYSFGMQVALHYLAQSGIELIFDESGDFRLGDVQFKRLPPIAGGYRPQNDGGHQMLLNYRALNRPDDIAPQVSLSDVLAKRVSPEIFKDRVILLGVTANSSSDFWATPYGMSGNQKVPGVSIQAQMISHILSAVLDGRPLLQVPPLWGDLLWLLGWAVAGGSVIWMGRSAFVLAGSIALLLGLGATCLVSLGYGLWLPLVPAIFTLGLSWGGMNWYSRSIKPQAFIYTLPSPPET